ncbi:E-selectin [Halotydeus destructor]|nr:E-selectin [Halotydeus destructor]
MCDSSDMTNIWTIVILCVALPVAQSLCPFPAIPNGIEETSLNYLRHPCFRSSDNLTADYRCTDPGLHLLFEPDGTYGLKSVLRRVCTRGQWQGKAPVCAEYSAKTDLEKVTLTELERGVKKVKVLSPTTKPAALLDEDGCLPGYANTLEYVVNLEKPIIGSYVEVEVKLGTPDDDPNVAELPIRLNIGPLYSCKIVAVKNQFQFGRKLVSTKEGLVKYFLQETLNYTTGNIYEVAIISFFCDVDEAKRGEVSNYGLIPAYYTDKVTIVAEEFYVEGFCDIRFAHGDSFKCGEPENVLFGKFETHIRKIVVSKVGFVNQAVVKYSCDEGFTLNNKNGAVADELHCGPDGRWIGQVPSCRPWVTCPFADAQGGERMNVKYEGYMYLDSKIVAIMGTTAIFSCKNDDSMNQSLALVGRQAIKCNQHGRWSSKKPECLHPSEFAHRSNIVLEPLDQIRTDSMVAILLAVIGLVVLLSIVVMYTFWAHMQRRLRAERRKAEPTSRRSSAEKEEPVPGEKKSDDDNLYYSICEYEPPGGEKRKVTRKGKKKEEEVATGAHFYADVRHATQPAARPEGVRVDDEQKSLTDILRNMYVREENA